MRGPPPTPTALKLARGNNRTNAQEPQPRRVMPKAPDHLDDAAKREWGRLAKLLMPLGVLTEADADALAAYSIVYARWADAERHLTEDGPVVKSPTGYPIQNPYLAIANKALEQMDRYLSKFGMTPADRTRIRVDAAGGGDGNGLNGFKMRPA